jgi:hypothetical protein
MYPVYVIGKENSESFFHAQLMRICQLVTFRELSNDVNTTEQVECVLWLAELQSLTGVQHHFKMQYGHQPPTQKSIRFWDNKLRTTGSLLCVKSPGKTWTSEEKTMTGRSYLDMLELYALPQLPPQTIL